MAEGGSRMVCYSGSMPGKWRKVPQPKTFFPQSTETAKDMHLWKIS